MRWVWRGVLFLGLTLLTQVGGLAYLLALASRRARLLVFLASYAAVSVASAWIAPAMGRVPLPCFGDPLRSAHVMYCALNRHYVTPEVLDRARGLAAHMEATFPGTVTLTLDGNFPFLDGFPLLPHLSHDDGEKLDFAFFYQHPLNGYAAGKTPSPIGYWAFERPLTWEARPCAGRGDLLTMRWDMGWLQPLWPDLAIEPDRSREALRWLAEIPPQGRGVKILLEPHLKERLGLAHQDIRFQGCRAARHDDHIHYQVQG